jgi:acetylglutamate synthase
MEKVWLEIRSNEQQKQPQYQQQQQQQQQLKSNEATETNNTILQESSHSIQIDARKPVEV